jgi:hypothetical protein
MSPGPGVAREAAPRDRPASFAQPTRYPASHGHAAGTAKDRAAQAPSVARAGGGAPRRDVTVHAAAAATIPTTRAIGR